MSGWRSLLAGVLGRFASSTSPVVSTPLTAADEAHTWKLPKVETTWEVDPGDTTWKLPARITIWELEL